MGLSSGFLRGSLITTPARKNLLCLRLRPSPARLRRQRLATVTSAGTTGGAAAASTVLARPCPTPTNLGHLGPRYGAPVRSLVPASPLGRTTTTGPAPHYGSQKPCRSSNARLSLLPAQTYDYYTTHASAALPTPRKTEPHVYVSAGISKYHTKSAFFPSRNPNLLLLQAQSPFPQPSAPRLFSTSPFTMTAIKLDGTAIAKSIRERLAAEVVEKQKLNPQYQPSLKIIQGSLTVTSPLS